MERRTGCVAFTLTGFSNKSPPEGPPPFVHSPTRSLSEALSAEEQPRGRQHRIRMDKRGYTRTTCEKSISLFIRKEVSKSYAKVDPFTRTSIQLPPEILEAGVLKYRRELNRGRRTRLLES